MKEFIQSWFYTGKPTHVEKNGEIREVPFIASGYYHTIMEMPNKPEGIYYLSGSGSYYAYYDGQNWDYQNVKLLTTEKQENIGPSWTSKGN